MDTDIEIILTKYAQELAAMTRRALVAEAQRDTLLREKEEPEKND